MDNNLDEKKSMVQVIFEGENSIQIADIKLENTHPLQIIALASLLELYAKSELAEARASKLQEMKDQEILNTISTPKIEIAR